MLVKICGLTNLIDAQFAAETGADLLGFVFVEKSKRYVTIEQVNTILDGMRGPGEPVGLFVNQEINAVVETASKLSLKMVQLHGQESPEYVDELARGLPDCRFIKAFTVESPDSIPAMEKYYTALKNPSRIYAFLLDGPGGGGTGARFEWRQTASDLFAVRSKLPKIFLAGGLTIENVSDAINILKPDGVDVSSGVELAPGKKDEQKIKRFITIAKEYK